MLKKLIIVLTIAVYGVPSSGMTFYIHYCCGKVDKINLSGSDNKKCPFVFQASSAKGCCDSKKVEVKIKSDHEPGYSIKNFCKLFSDSHTLTASAVISFYTLPYSILSYSSTSPPLQENVSLYKLNCIYRI